MINLSGIENYSPRFTDKLIYFVAKIFSDEIFVVALIVFLALPIVSIISYGEGWAALGKVILFLIIYRLITYNVVRYLKMLNHADLSQLTIRFPKPWTLEAYLDNNEDLNIENLPLQPIKLIPYNLNYWHDTKSRLPKRFERLFPSNCEIIGFFKNNNGEICFEGDLKCPGSDRTYKVISNGWNGEMAIDGERKSTGLRTLKDFLFHKFILPGIRINHFKKVALFKKEMHHLFWNEPDQEIDVNS